MFRVATRAFACLILAALAACTTVEIPFDHAANPNIKTIGVIAPGMPARAQIVLASDVGQSFGLIGALVDAAMLETRNSKFDALLTGKKFDARSAFVADVKSALAAHGYAAIDVSLTRSSESDLLKAYPKPGADNVDAYLDLALVGNTYGFVAAGIADSTPYRPFAYMKCRLVRASDGATLMEDVIAYNPIGNPSRIVTIAPDPAYSFADFDALIADPDRAVKGLEAALHSSSDAVGTLVQ